MRFFVRNAENLTLFALQRRLVRNLCTMNRQHRPGRASNGGHGVTGFSGAGVNTVRWRGYRVEVQGAVRQHFKRARQHVVRFQPFRKLGDYVENHLSLDPEAPLEKRMVKRLEKIGHRLTRPGDG